MSPATTEGGEKIPIMGGIAAALVKVTQGIRWVAANLAERGYCDHLIVLRREPNFHTYVTRRSDYETALIRGIRNGVEKCGRHEIRLHAHINEVNLMFLHEHPDAICQGTLTGAIDDLYRVQNRPRSDAHK